MRVSAPAQGHGLLMVCQLQLRHTSFITLIFARGHIGASTATLSVRLALLGEFVFALDWRVMLLLTYLQRAMRLHLLKFRYDRINAQSDILAQFELYF